MLNLMAVFHMSFSMLMCGEREREKPSSDFEAHTYFSRYARWALREFLSEAESAVEQVGEIENWKNDGFREVSHFFIPKTVKQFRL